MLQRIKAVRPSSEDYLELGYSIFIHLKNRGGKIKPGLKGQEVYF